jgi:recombination DNA repair RAD52 pathway protein
VFYISERLGFGSAKFKYTEGHKLTTILNEMIGFDGWSSEIQGSVIDYADFDKSSCERRVGIATTVKIIFIE